MPNLAWGFWSDFDFQWSSRKLHWVTTGISNALFQTNTEAFVVNILCCEHLVLRIYLACAPELTSKLPLVEFVIILLPTCASLYYVCSAWYHHYKGD